MAKRFYVRGPPRFWRNLQAIGHPNWSHAHGHPPGKGMKHDKPTMGNTMKYKLEKNLKHICEHCILYRFHSHLAFFHRKKTRRYSIDLSFNQVITLWLNLGPIGPMSCLPLWLHDKSARAKGLFSGCIYRYVQTQKDNPKSLDDNLHKDAVGHSPMVRNATL